MNSKLLPCPFCGGPASIEHKEHDVIELGCDNVGCSVLPSTTKLSVKSAAESWNRRTLKHEMRETVE